MFQEHLEIRNHLSILRHLGKTTNLEFKSLFQNGMGILRICCPNNTVTKLEVSDKIDLRYNKFNSGRRVLDISKL